MYQTKVLTDLSAEPVSLDEAKLFLEIDFDDFDALITLLIKSARIASERFTGLSYGKKQISLVSDQASVTVPFGPFVELVTLKDKDDVAIPTDRYNLFGYESPVLTVLNFNNCFNPLEYDPYWDILGSARQRFNFWTLVYNTGFYTETDADPPVVTNTLPEDLKEAIKKRVANGFMFREDTTEQAVNACINGSIFEEFSHRLNPMI